MTGFNSKRQAAQAKLDDDDAQGYIADYEAALKIAYEIGFADGKKAAQPEQEPVAWMSVSGDWVTRSKPVMENHASKGTVFVPLYK